MLASAGAYRAGSAGVSALALLGALLVPKCPLCIAWLSALGLGVVGAAWLAPLVRVAGFVVAALGAVTVVSLEWRRRQRGCAAVRRCPR
jgi:hypothetical protein